MVVHPLLFFGVVGVFAVLPLVLGIWTAVDAGSQPEWAFTRAGTTKTLWIVLPLVSMFACGLVAIVVGIVWFSSTKPRVLAAASAGAGPVPDGPPGAVPSVPPPTSPVTPARWAPDPRGRHELRYWDGQRWTDDVSDSGRTGVDPLG